MPLTTRTSGVYAAGETGLAIMPKHYRGDGSKPGVILLHGNAEDDVAAFGRTPLTNNQTRMANAIADAGYPCFAPLAAGNAMANDTALARVSDAYAYLTGALGAKPGKVALLGLSMGGGTAMAWARANLASVSCMVLLEPMSDINDVITNNRAGLAAAVHTAYGARTDGSCSTTSGSALVTDGSAASGDVGKIVTGPGVPAGATVSSVTPGISFVMSAAATASGSVSLQIGGYVQAVHGPTHNPVTFASQLSGIPAHVWYATGDTIVIPSTVQSVISSAGWTDVHTVPGDHGSSMYNAVDVPTVVNFIRANA